MELRKDYILDRWVVVAKSRSKRPKEFKKVEHKKEGICYFCPGSEQLTPAEIGRVEEDGRWILRWFPNKFAAVEPKGGSKVVRKQDLVKANAYGYHEVIAETNDHNQQLWDLDKDHIVRLLKVYKDRINKLSKKKNIKYVLIFKNHGREGGTSLIHSHSQVVALSKVPTDVSEKAEAASKHKKCPYCRIIKTESRSKRKCFENKSFVAIAPYASRFNYEVMIMPKRHVKSISELSDDELADWAQIMAKVYAKLRFMGASFNHFIHYAPKGSNLHLQMEICPRIATWAGFEIGSGIIINSVSPEDAASFYRSSS
ncbi:MAG: galactose-1-phosphate uridylyltransferase [Nanoarchaeota archaeon]|nr:galactose-1-phosphate uridylyltransferase [Nanoarchaeota archaeon]MBU1703912.1 galactose-1-phosphate uridylyltransferase [Nanoarchaeota archaeon]